MSRPGIPQPVDSNHRFIILLCSYLRDLRLAQKAPLSTVNSYSDRLLHWCNFIERRIAADEKDGVPEAQRLFGPAKSVEEGLQLASDRSLEAWLTEQESAGNAATTMQRRADAFFHFYVSVQERGLVRNRIKVPTVNVEAEFKPALTTKPARYSADRRASKYGVVLKLRPRARKGERLHVPSDEEVQSIYTVIPAIFTTPVSARNTLLVKWYAQCGLRRLEWVHLYVRNVPSPDAVDDALLHGYGISVKLEVTKGGDVQYVDASAELLEATLDYIEGPRADIVKRFSKRQGYKEPKEVFLSETTGRALNPRSVSNLLKTIFVAAKAGGTGHRLRAVFLTNVNGAEARAEEIKVVESGGLKHAINWNNVKLRSAEKARHKNVSSQDDYVQAVRKQRSKAFGQDEIVSAHMELQEQRQELASQKAQVKEAKQELADIQAQLAAARALKAAAKAPAKRARTVGGRVARKRVSGQESGAEQGAS